MKTSRTYFCAFGAVAAFAVISVAAQPSRIVSGKPDDAALASASYVKLAESDLGDVWKQHTTGAPAGHDQHSAVWTGTEMIIWGGFYSDPVHYGARYNPTTDSWASLTTNGAPAARSLQTVVWTGTEMIIWGGVDELGSLNDGGRYNPAANSWTTVSTNAAPAARYFHTAVWTGTEMIIWGGLNRNGSDFFNDGGRYNPTANTWAPLVTNSAPSARVLHTAVWAGGDMIVWGGGGTNGDLNDGARYNPAANTWMPLSSSEAPGARELHTAVWTGTEMIVPPILGRQCRRTAHRADAGNTRQFGQAPR